MTYSLTITDRYAAGNQYGKITAGSKMVTKRAIVTPSGENIFEGCFDKKRAWDFAVDFLNAGGSEDKLNYLDLDMIADHAVIGVPRKEQREAIKAAAIELASK